MTNRKPQTPGQRHGRDLIEKLTADDRKYADVRKYNVFLVLEVTDEGYLCELLMLGVPGTSALVYVNFGYEDMDIHFIRTNITRLFPRADIIEDVKPDKVYVVELDIDRINNRVSARIVDEGLMLGPASFSTSEQDDPYAEVRSAYIARRKRTA